MTPCKELTGEKREKFKKWLKQFQKENDRSPTIEEVYDEATKTIVVEHFEAYGQCRDSRRIADLENKLANADYQLEGREVELKELNKKLSQAEADYDKMFWQKNEIISNLQAQIESTKWQTGEPIKGREIFARNIANCNLLATYYSGAWRNAWNGAVVDFNKITMWRYTGFKNNGEEIDCKEIKEK